MHGKFGQLSPGKASRHSTALPRFFAPHPRVQCFRVFVPQAVRPTLLQQMDVGSLSLMCAQIWVGTVHMKGGQAQTSHKSWLVRGREKKCPSPWCTRGSNPGSLDLNSKSLSLTNHWATPACLSLDRKGFSRNQLIIIIIIIIIILTIPSFLRKLMSLSHECYSHSLASQSAARISTIADICRICYFYSLVVLGTFADTFNLFKFNLFKAILKLLCSYKIHKHFRTVTSVSTKCNCK